MLLSRRLTKMAMVAGALTLSGLLGTNGVLPVSAHPLSKAKKDAKASYVVFDTNGSDVVTSKSSCVKSKGCPTGLRLTWSRSICVSGKTGASDRYPPIAGLLMQKLKPAPNFGPVVASCSTGIVLTWNAKNVLTSSVFQGTSSKGTVSYLPHHVNSFDFFFESGDGIVSATWLRNGKAVGAVALPKTYDDVSWHGSTPGRITYGSAKQTTSEIRAGAATAPHAVYYWRTGHSYGTTKATAPSDANDLNLKWFRNNGQSGPTRGCAAVGGRAWTSPLMPIVFTAAGVLNSRVGFLACPMVSGRPVPYDGIDVSWTSVNSGTDNAVGQIVPTLNGTTSLAISASNVPQPPAGSDGLIFGFNRDNFAAAQWTRSHALIGSPTPTHKGVKVFTWFGK